MSDASTQPEVGEETPEPSSRDILENIEEVSEPPQEPITRKDPKRVEQGKKLALISKEAKEKKMRERIEKENFSYLTSYGYPLITFASVLGVAWMMVFGNSTVRPDDVVVPRTVGSPEDLQPQVGGLRPVVKQGKSKKDKSNFESLG